MVRKHHETIPKSEPKGSGEFSPKEGIDSEHEHLESKVGRETPPKVHSQVSISNCPIQNLIMGLESIDAIIDFFTMRHVFRLFNETIKTYFIFGNNFMKFPFFNLVKSFLNNIVFIVHCSFPDHAWINFHEENEHKYRKSKSNM